MPEQQTRLLAERYELIAPLGRGTMGTVWRARDRVLGREVAVKEIRQDPGLTEEQRAELRERMVREGRLASRINHPSVAAIHDVLVHGNSPWIIMELIEARSLEQVIDEEGPLPPRLVAEIGVDLLGALRAAHAQGITHRDVKPGNVLITESGRVVLTDFGIAKAEGDSRLTKTGMVIGSPGYTAPERARGEYTGPESDIWSLGATLYFAVEGRPAYERSTIAETLAALLSENVDPPTQAGQLRPILTGLLHKDYQRRLSGAKAETLLRMVADTPTNEMPAITAEALMAQEAGVPDPNDTAPGPQPPQAASVWDAPPGRGGPGAQAPAAAAGPGGQAPWGAAPGGPGGQAPRGPQSGPAGPGGQRTGGPVTPDGQRAGEPTGRSGQGPTTEPRPYAPGAPQQAPGGAPAGSPGGAAPGVQAASAMGAPPQAPPGNPPRPTGPETGPTRVSRGPAGSGPAPASGPRPPSAYDPERTISVSRPKTPMPPQGGGDEASTVTTGIQHPPGQQVYPLPAPQQQPPQRGLQGPLGPPPGPPQAPQMGRPPGQEMPDGKGLGTDLFAIANPPEQRPTGNRNGMLVLMAVAAAAAVVIAVLIVALLSS
jgi:hypothetical protein